MSKLLLPILIAILFTTSCKKTDTCAPVTTTAPASETANVESYLSTNSITATKDSRGFYYKINTQGSSTNPTICNTVTVKYSGKLTNNNVFDSNNTGVSFSLSNLIVGWQEGIPLIGKGGSITLYLPPSLGYGSAGSGTIPANSILIFDINLVDFN